MKIGINLVRFADNSSGGNYVYSRSVLKELIDIVNSTHDLLYIFCKDKQRSKELFCIDDHDYVEIIEVNYIHPLIDMHFFMRFVCDKYDIDVFFSPSHLLPVLKPRCCNIATIHDLNFKYFPQGFLKDIYKNFAYYYATSQLDQIIAISNYTAKDINSYYPFSKNKVRIIYNGFNREIFNEGDSTYSTMEPYIVAIGHHQHKNAPFLLDVIGHIRETLPDIKLVVFGLSDKIHEDMKKMAIEKGVANCCTLLKRVTDSELARLYYNAKAFVFPSKFEGFGLPIIEAMHCGCPVVASIQAAIPEVVGDAGLVVAGFDAHTWADTILQVIIDQQIRSELITKGKIRAAQFSWQKNAQEIYKIMRQGVKNHEHTDVRHKLFS